MYETELLEKRSSQELVDLLGLEETLDELARASGVQSHRHVLKRYDDNVLRKALNNKMIGRRGSGKSKTWQRKQVEEHIEQIGLKKEDATDRTKWCNIVQKNFLGTRDQIRSLPLTYTKPDLTS